MKYHVQRSSHLIALPVHRVIGVDLYPAFRARSAGQGSFCGFGSHNYGLGLVSGRRFQNREHDFSVSASMLWADDGKRIHQKPGLAALFCSRVHARPFGHIDQAIYAGHKALYGGSVIDESDLRTGLRSSGCGHQCKRDRQMGSFELSHGSPADKILWPFPAERFWRFHLSDSIALASSGTEPLHFWRCASLNRVSPAPAICPHAESHSSVR
jgi:hypothetical protein